MKTNLKLLGMIAAAAIGMSASAHALTIDTFNTTQSVSDPGSSTGTVSDAGNILGGERDSSIVRNSGTSAVTMSFNDSGNGLLTLSNADSTATATVLWDGAGSAGLAGVDLTDGGGQNAFDLRIRLNDFGTTVTITVASAGGSSSLSLGTGGGIPSSSNIPLLFEYSSFAVASGTGADFSLVDSITMTINAPFTATDLQLDFFQTTNTEVAEPTTLALLGLGLLGAGVRRRKAA